MFLNAGFQDRTGHKKSPIVLNQLGILILFWVELILNFLLPC